MLPAQEIDCSCIPTLLGSICITLIIAEFLHIFFVSSTVLKWFYNTSTGAVTGAARCGSFVGGRFDLLVASYEGIRWTRGFTWFGPPERNILRPRVNGVVLLCLSARLRSSLFSLCQPVCVWSSSRAFVLCDCRLPGPFIAQGRIVTARPHGPTGGPGADRPLRS
jgi:hypothetical protein